MHNYFIIMKLLFYFILFFILRFWCGFMKLILEYYNEKDLRQHPA